MGKLVFLLLAVPLCLAACQQTSIKGSGKVVSETRPASGFDRVSLGAWGDAVLIQGPEEGVEVTTDDNIMEYVSTEVRDGVLYLELDKRAVDVRPSQGIKYVVRLKTLKGIAVSGAGDVRSDVLESEALDVSVSGAGTVALDSVTCRGLTVAVSGAGDIIISGRAETQSVAISGAGSYSAGDFETASASVSISGTGDARVWATGTLEIQVSGTGSVLYYGEPEVTRSISGVGSVTSLGAHGTSV